MRKVALRGLLARRTRLALTAFAVALGVTLIAGTYVFTDTINSSFDRIFTSSLAKTDVAVTPNDDVKAGEFEGVEPIPADVVREISGLPDVAAASGTLFDESGTILDGDGDPISNGAPNFIASRAQLERFEVFDVAEGRMPEGPGEVALDKSTADRKDFEVGGTVDVVGREPRKTYEVVGTVQIAGSDSFGGAGVALMTLPEAQRMAGKAGELDQIDVAGAEGIGPEALRQRIDDALPPRYEVRTGEQEATAQTDEINDDFLGFLTTGLLAFAGIALFVGAFIIFNTFSITVAQRAREFALLRTLGASRAQVLRSVLTEGAVLGTLGSLVGLGAGIFVAKGLKAMFYAIGFDLPSQGTVLETRTIVVSLAVGVVVTLAASLAPALRATRVPPVAALQEGVAMPESRSSRLAFPLAVVLTAGGIAALVAALAVVSDTTTGLTVAGVGAAATFVGVGLMSPKLVVPIAAVVGRPLRGITGRLARENAVRQPGRTATTAAALMIGVALVSFASIFAASAKETVAGYVDRGLTGDAVVQNQDGFTPFSGTARERVAALPGVDDVAALRFAQVQLDGEDESVTGVDPETLGQVYDVTSGGEVVAGLRDGEIAVSEDYADDEGLQAGSVLTVRTARRAQLELRVAGTYEDKAELLGDRVVPNTTVQRDIGVSRDSYLFLGLADGQAAQAAVDRALERDFPQTEALTPDEFKNEQAAQIDQLLGLIYALLALAIIVSLFGIVNTLVLSITERTRELGMLRAIGTSRRQIRRMIRQESMIIAVIGGVLGLAVGIALAIVFTASIEDIELHVPAASLAVLLVLSAIAGVLAAVIPARRAAGNPVLEALAHQ